MPIIWTKIIPRWSGDVIEPPEAKKDVGYIAGDKPPAKWENWLRKGTYEALEETRAVVEDIDSQLAQKVSENDLDQLVSANSILTKIKTVDGAGSGLDADLLDNKHAEDFVNAIAIGSNSDPNTTLESYILSNHANSPSSSYYWHIQTLFYSTKAVNSNRVQIATSYNSDNNMYIRRYFNNAWSDWTRLMKDGDSMIKSIQRGSNVLNSTTITQAISAINIDKSTINLMLKVGPSRDASRTTISAEFASSSSIIINSNYTGSHYVLWEVIEFV